MKSSSGTNSTKSPSDHQSELRLAIEIGDRIVCHSYKLPSTPSWLHFEKYLQTKLSLKEFTVKYRDEDGDEISLSSDQEFSEVLNVYERINTVLLLRVTPVDTDLPKKLADGGLVDADGFPKQENVKARAGDGKITNVTRDIEDKYQVKEEESQVVVDVLPLNIATTQQVANKIKPQIVNKIKPAGINLGCRPKEMSSSSVPPEWFTNFMEKFKGDVSLEIAKKVMHRMQNFMIRNGCPVVKNEGAKLSEDGKMGQKAITNTIHTGVICDNCDQQVVGIRYTCGNCVKFDLCEKCENIKGVHEPHHVFIKMRYPCKVVGSRRNSGKMTPLLPHILYDYADVAGDDKPSEEIKRTNGDVNGILETPCCSRERKLLKRLEKQAHKLEKYREKHRQKDKAAVELIGGHHIRQRGHRNPVTMTESNDKSSSFSYFLDKSNYNVYSIDVMGAKFICDETFPDGSVVAPGTFFTKRWRILNSGNKAWPEDTVLKCIYSNGLHPRRDLKLPSVPAGEETIISLDFVAPVVAGSYESHWRLSHQDITFGHKIWCNIVVTGPNVDNCLKGQVINIPPDVQVEQIHANVQQEPENGEKEQVPDILKPGIDDTLAPKWAEFKSNDCGNNNNNAFGLLTPRSTTATPNNTPLDLTPPKSPELPEEEAEALFDDIGQTAGSDKNDDDKDVSFLSEDSDLGGSLVSLSSTDSDLGYVMVPMPPCFNFSVPVVYDNNELTKNNNNALSPDESLTEPVTPASKEENSSVTTVTDTEDENANESPITEKIFVNNETSLFPEPKRINNAIPLPPPPPPPPLPPPPSPPPSTENIAAAANPSGPSHATPDVCPDRIIPILPEPIMSAAATVFNSARGIITSIADLKVSQSVTPTVRQDNHSSSMNQLHEMGFYNQEQNARLLQKFKGDINSVVTELLQEADNDWHEHRH